MSDQTTQPTVSDGVETTEATDLDQAGAVIQEVTGNVFENSFNEAFDNLTKKTEGTPPEVIDTETETKVEEKAEDIPADDFDLTSLDKPIKRFDEELSIKEWMKKYGDEVPSIIQQGWNAKEKLDYASEQLKQAKEKESGIDLIVLQNIAYEIEKPIKTKEDFINDLRYDSEEDSEQAFEDYQKDFKSKYAVYNENRENAQMENAKMVKQFTEKFPDENIEQLYKEIQPYLNASVSKEQTPFPKNTLELFKKGRDHDKIVAQAVKEARADERKKAYDEFQGIDPQKVTNSPKTQNKRVVAQTIYDDPHEQSFQDVLNQMGG